jgi:hypothetical protein
MHLLSVIRHFTLLQSGVLLNHKICRRVGMALRLDQKEPSRRDDFANGGDVGHFRAEASKLSIVDVLSAG